MSIYSDNNTQKEARPGGMVVSDATAAQMAEFFSTFSDASRVKILAALVGGALNVGSIAGMVGISESAVSHHLRSLRQMRLVQAKKEGRQVFYSLDDEHIIEIFRAGLQHVAHE